MRINKNLWGLAMFMIGFSGTQIIISLLIGKTDPFVYVLNGTVVAIATMVVILIRRDERRHR